MGAICAKISGGASSQPSGNHGGPGGCCVNDAWASARSISNSRDSAFVAAR
eukprot:CAMPEP_0172775882 /NCGR_PEP_ID=MMETSP1074-20121228/198814_1 /TAXON_ID=2916 /ORGANISM="Ceratium fusus, Strain PA161109" /LENGTH=50 /DNA_ID=CAMNT_0013612559 /DNA_START=1116 /DNA_END=1268 /DNA_ORIENTATION=+